MAVSKSGIVFFVILFYVTISLFMGFAVDDIPSLNEYSSVEESALIPSTGNTEDFDLGGNVGKKANFLNNIVVGFKNLPGWINALVFSPLAILFTWIIVTTFIPTVDGGS